MEFKLFQKSKEHIFSVFTEKSNILNLLNKKTWGFLSNKVQESVQDETYMRFWATCWTRIIVSQRSGFIRNFCWCVLTMMSSKMFFQLVPSWTSIVTVWAFEGFLLKMNSFMSDEMWFFHETPATNCTSMRPNSVMGFRMAS